MAHATGIATTPAVLIITASLGWILDPARHLLLRVSSTIHDIYVTSSGLYLSVIGRACLLSGSSGYIVSMPNLDLILSALSV